MKNILLFHLLLWSLVNCQSSDDDSSISILGLAIEGFQPCPDGFIFMEREIGRRPSEENYWTGTFNLKSIKDLPEARIFLKLDNPATFKIDPDIARVYACGTEFRVFPYTAKDDVRFNILGIQNGGYPNIVTVKLNEQLICKNATKVTPTILGSQPVALGSFATSLEDFVPYCGRPQIDHTELIVNAKDTRPGDWPWHIALYSVNQTNNTQNYRCGGTIISQNSIVTASHCIIGSDGSNVPANELLVIAGKYNLNKRDPSAQEFQVSKTLVNEKYNSNNLRNDIAIIYLKTNIVYNQYIQPICLWTDYDAGRNISKEYTYGLNGTVVGWGFDENDTLSTQLGSGSLTIVSDNDCLLSYATFFERFLYEKSICAGSSTTNMNPCNGDSGGGLVIPITQPDNKISYFLRGIVSVTVSRTDKKVCDPNYYTIFTDAVQFLDWINQNKN